MTYVTLAVIAVFIERFLGYPPYVLKHIGHPVQWIGSLISVLDSKLNTERQDVAEARLRGVLALAALLCSTALPAWMLANILQRFTYGGMIEALLATAFIAQKSLREHVTDVAHALSSSLSEGRHAVAKIVGRETAALDESGVTKAALESLAENTADGIVAPVFWFALFGLPGIVAYKAINTADSMIGHRSERYLHFGWASAKLDDLVNLPASRACALLFAGAAFFNAPKATEKALKAAWQDAAKHRSPNAGWPESAMAGALGLRFGGPRAYDGDVLDLPWMGDGREKLNRRDIADGLLLYDKALWIMLALLVTLAVLL